MKYSILLFFVFSFSLTSFGQIIPLETQKVSAASIERNTTTATEYKKERGKILAKVKLTRCETDSDCSVSDRCRSFVGDESCEHYEAVFAARDDYAMTSCTALSNGRTEFTIQKKSVIKKAFKRSGIKRFN